MGMHLANLLCGGGQAGADGPNGIESNESVLVFCAIGNGVRNLPTQHAFGFTCSILGFRFANADYGCQVGPPAGFHLCGNVSVSLTAIRPALTMANNAKIRFTVRDHLSGNFAGMRTLDLCVAILSTDH